MRERDCAACHWIVGHRLRAARLREKRFGNTLGERVRMETLIVALTRKAGRI
jgi:hypothetical protein